MFDNGLPPMRKIAIPKPTTWPWPENPRSNAMSSEQSDITERYIREIEWSDQATEHEKTIVAGNIRSFASGVMRPLIAVKEHEKKMLRADLAALRAEIERLRADDKAVATVVTAQTQQIAALREQLEEAERAYMQSRDEKNATIVAMQNRIAELEAVVGKLEGVCDAEAD